MAEIAVGARCEIGVQRVAEDRRAERGHVHAQLVLASGHGLERVMPVRVAACEHVHACLAVRSAVDLAHAEERLAGSDAAAPHVRKREIRQGRRERLVALRDEVLAEQGLILRTAARIGREQHEARGLAVDAVQRHEIGIPQRIDEPAQQGLGDEATRRRDRQERGLVGDDEVVVDVQDRRLERDDRLVLDLAHVVHAQAFAVRMILRQRRAVGRGHAAAREAVQPGLARDRREVRAQGLEHRRPWPRRQVQRARRAGVGEASRRHGEAAAIHRIRRVVGYARGASRRAWRGRPEPAEHTSMSGIWQQVTSTVASEFSDLPDVAELTRVTVRLLIAAVLGGLLGFEREQKGKAAGVKTHMLVALGSAIFMIIPLQIGVQPAELTRVMQGMVAGVGFLGAGTILKAESEQRVKGLTTAAGIWMTSAIGMTAGLGQESSAVLCTLLALIVFSVMPRIMRLVDKDDGDDERKPG